MRVERRQASSTWRLVWSSERWAADRDSGAGPRGAAYERTAPRLLSDALLPKRARGALASNSGVARILSWHVPRQLSNQRSSVGGARLCDPRAKFRHAYLSIPVSAFRTPSAVYRVTTPSPPEGLYGLAAEHPSPFAGTAHSNFTGAHWDGRSHPASISRPLPTPAPLAPRKPYFRPRRTVTGDAGAARYQAGAY